MPTLDLQVAASADDCSFSWNGSAWVFGLTDLKLTAGYYLSNFFKAGGGMRFLNVTIPKGANITTAYLILTGTDADTLTVVNSRIIGNLEADAAAFSNLADYQARRGTDVGGGDDTKRTIAEVAWDGIGSWTVNVEYQSPEIKTIIQEIINQSGWVSGNDLALFWDDHEGRSTASNGRCRRAFAYNYSTTKCAQLHIEYTEALKKPGILIF